MKWAHIFVGQLNKKATFEALWLENNYNCVQLLIREIKIFTFPWVLVKINSLNFPLMHKVK